MLIPDINVLIYAHDTTSPFHQPAHNWWLEALAGGTEIGLPWIVVLGFIRITTNGRLGSRALTVPKAISHVRNWLTQPRVRILPPGERHGEILFDLLEKLGTGGNLTTDAHLAALAIEYHGVIVSWDNDFARFPGLRWRKPF
jgi:toxin-antitoxin system PIN domain toxin